MEYVLIALGTLVASMLTFYSGFGLGTALMPFITLFVPLPLAIGITAAIHLFQNLLKTGLLWKMIQWPIALRFGTVACLAAIPGAWTLQKLAFLPTFGTYTIFGIHAAVSCLHTLIGFLLIAFATLEASPNSWIKYDNLYLSGCLSGFFGGLSGNQGAFRSAFLLHTHLGKEAFIATNAAIAIAVDLIRLIIYGMSFEQMMTHIDLYVLISGFGGAILGTSLGMFLLPRVTIALIQTLIMILLYGFGVLFITGLL